MKELGKAIRLVRTVKGMKQEELGNLVGVADSYISLLEQGKRNPTWSILQKIGDSLGVGVSVLVMLSESDNSIIAPMMPSIHNTLWEMAKKEKR